MKVFWVDTETGGLNCAEHALLQLSAIIEIDGEVVERVNYRVKKPDHKTVTPESVAIHGLDPSVGEDYREVFWALVAKLNKYIDKFDRDDKFIIKGYGISFDVGFLRELFSDCNCMYYGSYFWHPPIDIMSYAADKLAKCRSALPNFKLGTLCEFFGVPLEAHDSMSDIEATRELYLKLKRVDL